MNFSITRWAVFLATVVSVLGLSLTLARAQTIPVNFGVTFRNARLASLWIGEEEGFFKKQGLALRPST